MRLLDIRAGHSAANIVRARGLQADDIDLLVGASGGPKWLALAGIDDWLMRGLLPQRTRPTPLPLVGASIGSWRMACFASPQPQQAHARLLAAYFTQRYAQHPTPAEVSAECARVLQALLTPDTVHGILHNRQRPLHVLVTEARGRAAGRDRNTIALGLAAAALRNLGGPAGLGRTLHRVVLHTGPDAQCTRFWQPVPTRQAALQSDTLGPALLASGSIPLVLAPVREAGAEQAWYDGGIVDYHPLPLLPAQAPGLVLYPHFYTHLVPGWFDKLLRWRHTPAAALDRVLLIAPSAEWVATLPGGRIPDRRDFSRLDPDTRVRAWQQVVGESARLGDTLHEWVERGQFAHQMTAFPGTGVA